MFGVQGAACASKHVFIATQQDLSNASLQRKKHAYIGLAGSLPHRVWGSGMFEAFGWGPCFARFGASGFVSFW